MKRCFTFQECSVRGRCHHQLPYLFNRSFIKIMLVFNREFEINAKEKEKEKVISRLKKINANVEVLYAIEEEYVVRSIKVSSELE